MALKKHEFWRTKFSTSRTINGKRQQITVFSLRPLDSENPCWVFSDGKFQSKSFNTSGEAKIAAEEKYPSEDMTEEKIVVEQPKRKSVIFTATRMTKKERLEPVQKKIKDL
jgi:hypothetical protein